MPTVASNFFSNEFALEVRHGVFLVAGDHKIFKEHFIALFCSVLFAKKGRTKCLFRQLQLNAPGKCQDCARHLRLLVAFVDELADFLVLLDDVGNAFVFSWCKGLPTLSDAL